jgi:hypothetical protein
LHGWLDFAARLNGKSDHNNHKPPISRALSRQSTGASLTVEQHWPIVRRPSDLSQTFYVSRNPSSSSRLLMGARGLQGKGNNSLGLFKLLRKNPYLPCKCQPRRVYMLVPYVLASSEGMAYKGYGNWSDASVGLFSFSLCFQILGASSYY